MLLFGLSMISPVPFSHIAPAVIIMVLALAYLEEGGLVLLIALGGRAGGHRRDGERSRRSIGAIRRCIAHGLDLRWERATPPRSTTLTPVKSEKKAAD